MPDTTTSDKTQPLSVGQLNRQAKHLLEGHFTQVWVEGEISNYAAPSSGHWYFSLKDSRAQIRCAMFRNRNSRIGFIPEGGQQVVVRGKLSLYEARGDYQLIVEHMALAGDGALARAFEELKQRLSLEGLFDIERKRPLPSLPQHIAIITSPTGAAIHDILTVLERRFPSIPVSILPVPVQGNEAAPAIADAIQQANSLAKQQKPPFDVIIIGRGGGSLEDLWAFNEEIVARAIAASELPVVSAVGHEVDVSIADLAADVRAPTPSAAAELLSPDRKKWLSSFQGYQLLLVRAMQRLLKDKQQQLLIQRSLLRHPGSRLQEFSQRLDELELRLHSQLQQQLQLAHHRLQLMSLRLLQCSPQQQLQAFQLQLNNLGLRLQQAMELHLHQQAQRLKNSMHLLHTVSPLATLERGYSIVFDEKNQLVQNASRLKVGDRISARLAEGQLHCTVDSVEPTCT